MENMFRFYLHQNVMQGRNHSEISILEKGRVPVDRFEK
jgi:hypothetical protein